MYGYLKYKNGNKVDKVSRMYKCYYCSLCHALKRNYGMMATALLSYDLVFAAIALSFGNVVVNNKPECCIYKSKRKISAEYESRYWKDMATVSVALAYSKVLDNCLDKPTVASKAILKLFSFLSRKARKSNPDMFTFLRDSMRGIKNAENNNAGLEIQSSLTADMISGAFCSMGSIAYDGNTKEFLRTVSQWLCLVDAIDDYERDRKKGSYNPLFMLWDDADKAKNSDRDIKSLIASKYIEIADVYSGIFSRMESSLESIRAEGNERIFLYNMVHRVMPQRVAKLLVKHR